MNCTEEDIQQAGVRTAVGKTTGRQRVRQELVAAASVTVISWKMMST